MNTKPKYFKAWIVFFLVATVGGFVVGASLGAVAGMAIGIANQGDISLIEQNAFLFRVAGFIAALPVSFLVYRWSIKTYILPQIETPQSQDERPETLQAP